MKYGEPKMKYGEPKMKYAEPKMKYGEPKRHIESSIRTYKEVKQKAIHFL